MDVIGSIKKQIFLSLGLFFSCSNLSAMCPQTVGTVTPGEGIWRVTSRIGEATNVIQSQICALNLAITSTVSNIGCSFTFGQTDIGSGGIYTISVPGTYCMSENVTFTFGPAITINSSDVTLDLEGHYIDGGSNPVSSAIQLATGVGSNLNNIIIQNGTIQNLSGSLPFPRGIGQGGTNSSLVNVVIRDMNFYNIVGTTFAVGYAYNAISQSILIENCATVNGGAIWALTQAGGSAIVRNIRVEQSNQGFAEILVESILGITGLTESVVVEDCIITTSAPTPSYAYVDVGYTSNAVVRNCITDGGDSLGFLFLNVNNLVVSDCIAQNTSTIGFSIALVDSVSVVIERCVAQHNGQEGFRIETHALGSLNMIDCVANNNLLSGFVVDCLQLSVDATTFKNCYAAQNSVCGFLLTNASGNGVILNSAFDGCVAQGNGGDGFNLDNILGGSPFANISFNDCISQGNRGGVLGAGNSTFLGDGFGLNSATNGARLAGNMINNVVFNNCIAQQNGNDGFDFGATVTLCKILDCCAMNNTGTGIANAAGNANKVLGNAAFNNGGADISGVSDPSLLVSSALVGGLAGATRWVNAIS